MVLFLQTVEKLVKELDFCIVCVCLGGGVFFQRARRLVTCEGFESLYFVCVCGVGVGVGSVLMFLQRARRLVKGLYLCIDVPVL